MSKNTTYNVRIDSSIRQQADTLYKSMGLTLSTAINLFLTQSVIQGRLPLNEVVAEPPYVNLLLQDAIEVDNDLEKGIALEIN